MTSNTHTTLATITVIEKVSEYWPQCHELCMQLMANQPAALAEIAASRGQSTGR